jgi:hypothetical protein
MSPNVSSEQLIHLLNQVVSGRYGGKPFFIWQGQASELRSLLARLPEAANTKWLCVNNLAEDVIPRLARQTLLASLEASLQGYIASGCRLLVVTDPYLLHRYEPSAPLAPFWNCFLSSERAVVVVLPPPVCRPTSLPYYVAFAGDDPSRTLTNGIEALHVGHPNGGSES